VNERLPEGFIARVIRDVGEAEAAALLAALAAAPDRGLRLHPRFGDPSAAATRLALPHAPLAWCTEGVQLTHQAAWRSAALHPWHDGGAYYLQDPAAMGVVPLLDPQPGEWILDLAAAPGGKSTHAEARLARRGLLWAHDHDPQRTAALQGNLERWGATQAIVTQGDPGVLRPFAGRFDRVLLDAPCSGEGMFRKSSVARAQWSEALGARCATLQSPLLALAAELVAPGGVIVYATCTFARAENEERIERLLASRDDLDLDGDLPAGTTPGFGGIGARWWPHRSVGDGHYAVRLRKRAGAEAASTPVARRATASRAASHRAARGHEAAAYRAFVAERFGIDPLPDHDLAVAGAALIALPAGAPVGPWRRSGVALGTLSPGRSGLRFAPHHALARVFEPAQQGAFVDVSASDPLVGAYLAGEPIALSGSGWWVVRADGVALGWVKAGQGVANNHYPRALRRTAPRLANPDEAW
jgi:16S rRNA C967 or C1407 C5-methylase (RsmB/RsmF family)/NOL1/NOP2/fmu family ribosome biogenesis protein